MEKDRYFIIFRHKYLQVLKENKFKILEDVRNVKVANNDVHLTISIGLGVHADSYTKKYDYARAAIDLAIGRGGDQAVIKDGEDINYYGGNNLQKDINTRVRAELKPTPLTSLSFPQTRLTLWDISDAISTHSEQQSEYTVLHAI